MLRTAMVAASGASLGGDLPRKHSDRGMQFTSSDYQRFLTDHHITSCISEVGDCGDNAAA